MAITLQKAQTINGTRYDAFTVVTGLSAADEQRLLQGGDALPVDLSGAVSGAGNAAILTIAAPDGTDVGDVLTATPSTGWTVSGYQWTRDGADISGATSSTYTLTSADGGKLVGCRAVDAVYSALTLIPSYAPTLPAGYLSLDSSVLTLDSSVLSLV